MLENSLTVNEKLAVKLFLKAPLQEEEEEETKEEGSYKESILKNADGRKRLKTDTSKYRSTEHVSSTTNIVEQIISQAKLIMNEKRKKMDPDILFLLLFLKMNRHMFDERVIQHILDNNNQDGDNNDIDVYEDDVLQDD